MSEKYGLWDVFKDFFKGDLHWVDRETFTSRYQQCLDCAARDKTTNTCTVCGCWLPAKTRLQKSSCPMEKW